MFVKGARDTPPPAAYAYEMRIAQLVDGFGDGFLVLDPEWRVLVCNAAAKRHLKSADGELVGRALSDLAPGMAAGDLTQALTRALLDQCPVQGEAESEAHPGHWLAFRVFPVENGVAIGFRDVSEQRDRRRRNREQADHLAKALGRVEELESRHAFLLQLSDTLRALDEPEAILGAAARLIGERLGASRVGYAEVAPDGKKMITGGNWVKDSLPTFTNRTYPKDIYGRQVIAQLEAGKIVRVNDVETDPRAADSKATYEAMNTRSFISVPLLSGRKMDALFSLMAPDPRIWSDDDALLAEEVAARTWTTLQRARSERALRESEARFRSMADCAPSPVWVTGADGRIEFVNQAYSQTLEAPAEKLLGDVWLDNVHPDDLGRLLSQREESWRSQSAYAFEVRMMHPGGHYRTMHITCRPRLDDHGIFQGYVGMSFDVTDLRQAQERQDVLIKELNHRVKNTLATVQSIVHQVLRKDPMHVETRRRITERLIALSAAHDVLTRQNWQYADLMDVIREAIHPYTDPQAPRIELSGPPVRLTPNVAVAMAMALHELGANALRHGALSAPSGSVGISWRIAETGGLELEWRERGGPRLGGTPTETGFGSRVLSGLIAEFGKAAELEFTPTGLHCRMTAPVATE